MLSDETLAEIRQGLADTQADMHAYRPGDVRRASQFNVVSHFDRIVADTYAFTTVPALLGYVDYLRAQNEALREQLMATQLGVEV